MKTALEEMMQPHVQPCKIGFYTHMMVPLSKAIETAEAYAYQQPSVSRETAEKMLEALQDIKSSSYLNGCETKDDLISDINSIREKATAAIQQATKEIGGGEG